MVEAIVVMASLRGWTTVGENSTSQDESAG